MNRQNVALSGVAMTLVVLHHSIDLELAWVLSMGGAFAEGWQLYLLTILHRLGKVAVPLFLFIAGSFMAYSVRGEPRHLPWKTVRGALTRLIWPYVFWSLIFYLLVYFQRGEQFSLLGYVKNLLVGYPFHFVPLLLFFYAIAPFLVRGADRHSHLLIAGVALYQLFLILAIYPETLGFALPSWTHYLVPPVLGQTLALWAIYFPLGLILALYGKQVKPWLQRSRWWLLGLALGLYTLDVLNTASAIHFPMAEYLFPLALVLLAPLVQRNSIPRVGEFEAVGRRSYGLYLTHLLVIDLLFFAVQEFAPWMFGYQLLLAVFVFALAMALPLFVMNLSANTPARTAYRYVFG